MPELQQTVGKRRFEGDCLVVGLQAQAFGFEFTGPIVSDAADGGDRRDRLARPGRLGEGDLAAMFAGFDLAVAAPFPGQVRDAAGFHFHDGEPAVDPAVGEFIEHQRALIGGGLDLIDRGGFQSVQRNLGGHGLLRLPVAFDRNGGCKFPILRLDDQVGIGGLRAVVC